MAEIRKQTGLHDETPFNLKWLDVEGKGEGERGREKGESEGERGRGKGEEGERMWWKLKERAEEEGGRKEEDSRGWARELGLRKAKVFPCHCCHAMTPVQSTWDRWSSKKQHVVVLV